MTQPQQPIILDTRVRDNGIVELDVDLDGQKRVTFTVSQTAWQNLSAADTVAMVDLIRRSATHPPIPADEG